MLSCKCCCRYVPRTYTLGNLIEIYKILISASKVDLSVSVCSWCYITLTRMALLRDIAWRGNKINKAQRQLMGESLYNYQMKINVDLYDEIVDHDTIDIKDDIKLEVIDFANDNYLVEYNVVEDLDEDVKLEYDDDLKLGRCPDTELIPKIKSSLYTAVLLTDEGVERERTQEISEIMDDKDMEYRCLPCLMSFNDQDTFSKHYKQHLPRPGHVQCELCKLYVRHEKSAMLSHNRKHFVRYACNTCEFICKTVDIIKSHCYSSHPSYKCKICGLLRRSKSGLHYHVKSKHSPKVICDICGKSFTSKQYLIVHLETHEPELYRCDKCGRGLKTKASFMQHKRNHVKRETSVPTPAFCVECNMTFKSFINYRNHLRYSLKHADTPKVPCPVCQREFVLERDMLRHNEYNHLGIGDKCKICDKLCKRPDGLKRHMKEIHGNKEDRIRNHTCEQCGRSYYTPESLREHKRTHSDERTQRCDMCDATFKLKATLYQHKRLVHLKIKKKQPANRIGGK